MECALTTLAPWSCRKPPAYHPLNYGRGEVRTHGNQVAHALWFARKEAPHPCLLRNALTDRLEDTTLPTFPARGPGARIRPIRSVRSPADRPLQEAATPKVSKAPLLLRHLATAPLAQPLDLVFHVLRHLATVRTHAK